MLRFSRIGKLSLFCCVNMRQRCLRFICRTADNRSVWFCVCAVCRGTRGLGMADMLCSRDAARVSHNAAARLFARSTVPATGAPPQLAFRLAFGSPYSGRRGRTGGVRASSLFSPGPSLRNMLARRRAATVRRRTGGWTAGVACGGMSRLWARGWQLCTARWPPMNACPFPAPLPWTRSRRAALCCAPVYYCFSLLCSQKRHAANAQRQLGKSKALWRNGGSCEMAPPGFHLDENSGTARAIGGLLSFWIVVAVIISNARRNQTAIRLRRKRCKLLVHGRRAGPCGAG